MKMPYNRRYKACQIRWLVQYHLGDNKSSSHYNLRFFFFCFSQSWKVFLLLIFTNSFDFLLIFTYRVLEVFYQLIFYLVFFSSLPSLGEEVFHQRYNLFWRFINFFTRLRFFYQSLGFSSQFLITGLRGFSLGFFQKKFSIDSTLSETHV